MQAHGRYRRRQRRPVKLQLTHRDRLIALLIILLLLLVCGIGGWIAFETRHTVLFDDEDSLLNSLDWLRRPGFHTQLQALKLRRHIVERSTAPAQRTNSPFLGALVRLRVDSVSRCSQLCSSGPYSRRVGASQSCSGRGGSKWTTRPGRGQLPALRGDALHSSGSRRWLRFCSNTFCRRASEGGWPDARAISALRAV